MDLPWNFIQNLEVRRRKSAETCRGPGRDQGFGGGIPMQAMDPLGKAPASSEITREAHYLRRREFIKSSLLLAATGTGVGASLLWLMKGGRAGRPAAEAKAISTSSAASSPAATRAASAGEAALWTDIRKSPLSIDEAQTSFEAITSYNNFYEFGLDKRDPSSNVSSLRTRPWTVTIEGECQKPMTVDIDTILRWAPLEERV